MAKSSLCEIAKFLHFYFIFVTLCVFFSALVFPGIQGNNVYRTHIISKKVLRRRPSDSPGNGNRTRVRHSNDDQSHGYNHDHNSAWPKALQVGSNFAKEAFSCRYGSNTKGVLISDDISIPHTRQQLTLLPK